MKCELSRVVWIVLLLFASVATVDQAVAQCWNGELGGLNGLIGYWSFDEEEGAVAHDLSPGHLSSDGQLYNFPTDNSQWVLGRIGHALQYDGSNDFMLVPNYPKPTTSISFTGWVWADVNTITYQSIVKNWGGSRVGQFHFGIMSTSRKLELAVRQSDGAQAWCLDSTEMPTGRWVFVAFVADSHDTPPPSLKVYRDVEVVASTTYNGTLLSPPMSAIGVGVKTNDAGTWADSYYPGPWDGKFDDFGLWNRALTALEVRAIYRAGLHGLPLTKAVVADFDADADVDGDDLAAFASCHSGPTVAAIAECGMADFDGDCDVDQSDFGIFQRCWSGSNVPADPDCAN